MHIKVQVKYTHTHTHTHIYINIKLKRIDKVHTHAQKNITVFCLPVRFSPLNPSWEPSACDEQNRQSCQENWVSGSPMSMTVLEPRSAVDGSWSMFETAFDFLVPEKMCKGLFPKPR